MYWLILRNDKEGKNWNDHVSTDPCNWQLCSLVILQGNSIRRVSQLHFQGTPSGANIYFLRHLFSLRLHWKTSHTSHWGRRYIPSCIQTHTGWMEKHNQRKYCWLGQETRWSRYGSFHACLCWMVIMCPYIKQRNKNVGHFTCHWEIVDKYYISYTRFKHCVLILRSCCHFDIIHAYGNMRCLYFSHL